MAQSPAPDPNARSLYVGNIDTRVTDTILQETFDGAKGKVVKVKLIKDKQTGANSGFGFVEFEDHEAAEAALQKFNGHKLMDNELKVNWANSHPNHSSGAGSGGHNHYNSHNHSNNSNNYNSPKPGPNGLYNVFVGDLDPSVDDTLLTTTFQAYPSLSDARVMSDHETGRSRGYGFVMFKEKQDAQNAIQEMNGKPLASRNLRLNWAHPRSDNTQRKPSPSVPLDYNEILAQSSPTNVTVYVGNMGTEVTEAMLREVFTPHGEIEEVRGHPEKGYGFIMFKEREAAARAIVALSGKTLGSKQIKCHWGREKDHPTPLHNTSGIHLQGNPYIGQNQGVYPFHQYNMTYPAFQYSFPGIPPQGGAQFNWWPGQGPHWAPQSQPVPVPYAGTTAGSQTPQQPQQAPGASSAKVPLF